VTESTSPVPPAAIFREYDIRGVVGTDLTEATATVIARAYAAWLKAPGATVVVGRDSSRRATTSSTSEP
jgi:phosphomannomutase/phosphoglucomutase